MQATSLSVEKYLSSLDSDVQPDMQQLHELISKHMPKVVPTLWQGKFWGGTQQSIIGYGDMTFINSKKQPVEWFMVGLALQKNYISVYNCAVEDGMYLVKKYADKLGKVKTGSSSISFKHLDDVNIEQLTKLIIIANDQLKA